MPKVLLESDLTIHYQRVGAGPDLVMIHGLSGNLAVWHLKMVPILRDHFRVLTFDMRGHGYSGVPATGVSIVVVIAELIIISWIRYRFMDTPFLSAAFQVIVGGVLVFVAGILIGSS